MRAIIEVDVPKYQIGQEVSIYFKDTMMKKGIVQEPKTGHWVDVDGLWFKCSECDAHRKMMPAYKEYYCPNCGAKMESEVRNETDKP